jgi:hypothetical protein
VTAERKFWRCVESALIKRVGMGGDLNPYDAYILHDLIQYNNWKDDWWLRLCYERYCTKTWYYPSLTKRLRPRRRALVLKHPLLTRPFLPFSDHFRCYAGQFWFTANRRAAEYILRFYATRPRLASHYRSSHVPNPEESYFQCVLANAPGLKLDNNDYRYIDWSRGGPHPKTLGMEDLPKLLSSTDRFARRFDRHAQTWIFVVEPLTGQNRLNRLGRPRQTV